MSYTYQYDSNGNVTTNAIAVYGDNTINRSVVNQYDSKNRITSSLYNGYLNEYSYDNNGFLEHSSHYRYGRSYWYSYAASIGLFYNISLIETDAFDVNNPNNHEHLSFTNISYPDYYSSEQLNGIDDDDILSDRTGNIVSIGSRQQTWTNIRLLESVTEGNNTSSYTYDENGIRTSKTVNGAKTEFYTNNGNVVVQKDADNTWCFQYDSSEEVIGFLFNDTQYYYIKNQMGDVIGIINGDGEFIAEYDYNDWGALLTVDKPSGNTATENIIADTNPMLYRGYYYDYETQYYYLQSRYYYPRITRFISRDDPDIVRITRDENVSGINFYAYCFNEPINNSDPRGRIPAKIVSAVVSGLITGVFDIIVQGIVYQFKHNGSIKGFKLDIKSLTVSILQGAACGILMTTRYKKLVQAVGSGIISSVGTAVKMFNKASFSEILKSSLIDFAIAAVIALLCGNGIGTNFWNKDFKSLIGKGQYVYKGVKLSCGKNGILISGSLKLVKPVVKELCKNLIKYIIGNAVYSIQSTLRSIFNR